jgi:dihydrodipicolinate synthase/N-acetylneuraminate lyase
MASRFQWPVRSADSQLKAAMQILGQPGGRVRSPLLSMTDPKDLAALRALLLSAELLADA